MTMRKSILSCIGFLFVTVSLVMAQDLSAYQKKEFKSESVLTLPYRILFPAEYDASKKYPLIILLHGGGERGTDNEKQLVYGAKLLLEKQKEFPAIVIAPQCPQDSYWASVKIDRSTNPLKLDFNYAYDITHALDATVSLARELMQTEAVDKDRVYIVGLSMGGMGTLEAVHRFPKLFAAAVAICGGGDVQAYNKKVKRIPFWLFHGTDDKVISVDHSRKMVQRLKELKAEVKYTEYPGVNHGSWTNAFAEPRLLPWLFSKHK